MWASLKRTPGETIEHAYAEASSRDPGRQKTWAVLVDGNRDQMRLVKQAAKDRGVEVTFVVDLIHALEYVWKAGCALLDEGNPGLERRVQERALRLLSNEASQVATPPTPLSSVREPTAVGWRSNGDCSAGRRPKQSLPPGGPGPNPAGAACPGAWRRAARRPKIVTRASDTPWQRWHR